MEFDMYDAIIIGGGPAGLAGALYCSRYNLKVLVLAELIGGLITESLEVENYPGTEKAKGMEMMRAWKLHAEKFGAEVKQEKAIRISKEEDGFIVSTSKAEYKSRSLLLAVGAKHRMLGVLGEKEFFGKGVSKCPTCDGVFFMDKPVAVIGGGNSALRGTQVMLQYASKVYLIHRREEFRAEPMLVDAIRSNPKAKFVLGRNVKEIVGDSAVTGLLLDNGEKLDVEGVFIEVGSAPNTELVEMVGVELEAGFIKVAKDQSTNIKGIYAAGDSTTGSNMFRQVITAAAEGAIAAQSIFEYNRSEKQKIEQKNSKEELSIKK
jgi:thioredoxin reductase (NADPH)